VTLGTHRKCYFTWQSAAGLEGSHLVNTGATGVSDYRQLSWDCGQVQIHFQGRHVPRCRPGQSSQCRPPPS